MHRYTRLKTSSGFENVRLGHDWQTPVWKGLVLDREGRHYRKIKSALWLLMYLILCAGRKTGKLKRKASTIGQEMGVKTRTVRAWLKALQTGGYINTKNSGRRLAIEVKKLTSYPQLHFSATQSNTVLSNRVTELCQSESSQKGRKTSESSQNQAPDLQPNDNTIKKYKEKNVNVVSNLMKKKNQNADKSLAVQICQALEDEKNLPLYLSYVKKYPIKIIKKAYEEAIRMPINKIKKTRGALFNYLVKHYAEKENAN